MEGTGRAGVRGGRGVQVGSNNNNNGWPLGLQPLHIITPRARSREQPQVLRFWGPDASPFFISATPSISSLSSSDLDTESTGSFFPERSTTLGTLIGIHTRSQRNQPAMNNVTAKLLQSKHMKKTQRLHACWCAFTLVMRCSSCSNTDVNPNEDSLSPSLAHLLELERRASHSQGPQGATLHSENFDEDLSFEEVEEHSHHTNEIALFDGVGDHSHPTTDNTLFNNDVILPPHPSGAPLKSALHQFASSPTATSSYLSTDWSARVPIVRKRKHYHAVNGRFRNSLCPSFRKAG